MLTLNYLTKNSNDASEDSTNNPLISGSLTDFAISKQTGLGYWLKSNGEILIVIDAETIMAAMPKP